MAKSAVESIKQRLGAARGELKGKRKELEREIAGLQRELDAVDADVELLDRLSGRSGRAATSGRNGGKREYGGVKNAVLAAIKAVDGIKPVDIISKAGLSSAQVHNSLTQLKKSKEVKSKGGLYYAA